MSGWANFGLTLAILGRTCWFFCSLIMCIRLNADAIAVTGRIKITIYI